MIMYIHTVDLLFADSKSASGNFSSASFTYELWSVTQRYKSFKSPLSFQKLAKYAISMDQHSCWKGDNRGRKMRQSLIQVLFKSDLHSFKTSSNLKLISHLIEI